MRAVFLVILFSSMAGFISCTMDDETSESPLAPGSTLDSRGAMEECRSSMRTIASQEVIYYATHGTYTDDLEALGLAGTVCPECGLEHVLYGDQTSFSVYCPMPPDHNHGHIIDGVASWPPGGQGGEAQCRVNMRTIASQEVIYFATHGTYTEDLEALGLSGLTCPTGAPYTIQVEAGGTEFFIECGMPFDPNHGCIDNGVSSWR